MKDPAVLFYTSDFISGTMLMPDDEVGRYIKLLCVQHQHGRLSKEQFFSVAKESDSQLIEKFEIDDDGRYYNVRMDEEADKRRRYSESRRRNRSKNICKTYAKDMNTHMSDHMSIHMGNENENRNSIKKEAKKKHGEYWHVLLTASEYSRLLDEWGQSRLDAAIKTLDEGIELKGYKYKNHNLALRKWERDRIEKAGKSNVIPIVEHRFCSKHNGRPLEPDGTCAMCEEEKGRQGAG